MKISYDPQVDAAYIRFVDGPVECQALEISEDIILNFGPRQELVGLEILDASSKLHLDPQSPKIELNNFTPIAAHISTTS